MKLGNDTANSLVYNTSGNLKINCTIPRSNENFPNYASVMLKSVSTDNKNVSLTDILLSFITDHDFIARYAYAEKLGKKVICMYEQNKNVSGMIRGNKNFEMIKPTAPQPALSIRSGGETPEIKEIEVYA